MGIQSEMELEAGIEIEMMMAIASVELLMGMLLVGK